jgi:hypothetical protein
MKNLLNNLSQSEKNRILEQYNNSLLIDTSKFKKLLESKLGDVKPLIENREDLTLINEESTIPFKNNNEGNRFRKWVNDNYPIVAKELQLDREGAYNNYYIQKAWNYFIGVGKIGETLGDKYIKSSNSITDIARLGAFGGGFDDSPSQKSSTPSKASFKNNTEGDEFRKWVNANYKDIAKSLDLDPIGKYPDSYNNATIQKALNQKVGNSTLGELFMMNKMNKMKKDTGVDWIDKISTDPVSTSKLNVPERTYGQYWGETFGLSDPKDRLKKRDEELKKQLTNPAFRAPETLKGADRINKEIMFINARSEFNGKPFFILDYYYNLVLAFDEKHKMIAWSYSVAGKDEQPEEVEDYDKWCQRSGEYYNKIGNGAVTLENIGKIQIPAGFKPPFRSATSKSNSMPKNPDVPKFYQLLDGHKYVPCVDANGRRFELTYNESGIVKSQASGIYKSDKMTSTGYQKKGQIDTIPISTLFGKGLGTAIHVTAPGPGRAEGMAGLKQSVTSQGITPEYITKVTKQKNLYDLSAGCFNVTTEFATNPEVKRISGTAIIFLMGDNETDYLVKADPQEYFNNLEQGGVCRNPEGVANSVGQKIDKFNNFS